MNDPWFGAWPPEFRGECQDMTRQRWAKAMPHVMLGLVFLSSIALLLGSYLVEDTSQRFHFLLSNLAIAGLSASIIGLLLEIAFVTQIAQNVFEVAFGYVLPRSLSEEVKWIYQLETLAVRHDQQYKFTALNHEHLKMWTRITRVIENLTDRTIELPIGISADEWFHWGVGQSAIVSLQITQGDQVWALREKEIILQKDTYKLNLDAAIDSDLNWSLGRGQQVTIVYEIEEIKRTNDVHYFFLSSPTRRPHITVSGFDGLDIHVGFAHRAQATVRNLGSGTYMLDGTLLPLQAIEVRWWRKEDSERWVKDVPQETIREETSNQSGI